MPIHFPFTLRSASEKKIYLTALNLAHRGTVTQCLKTTICIHCSLIMGEQGLKGVKEGKGTPNLYIIITCWCCSRKLWKYVGMCCPNFLKPLKQQAMCHALDFRWPRGSSTLQCGSEMVHHLLFLHHDGRFLNQKPYSSAAWMKGFHKESKEASTFCFLSLYLPNINISFLNQS